MKPDKKKEGKNEKSLSGGWQCWRKEFERGGSRNCTMKEERNLVETGGCVRYDYDEEIGEGRNARG